MYFSMVSFAPFVYLCETRLKGIVHKVSFIFLYFIPTIATYMYFAPNAYSIEGVLKLALALCLIDIIYANGYMQNDIFTIKKEANPTLRLSEQMLEKMQAQFGRIILGRCVFAVILFALLYVIDRQFAVFVGLGVIAIQILYLIYNSQRNMVNLFLVPFMSFLRFFAVSLPYIDEWGTILGLFALYPLSKFLEFCVKPRFKISLIARKIITNLDKFRVVYYALYSLVFGLLWWCGKSSWIFLALGLYFLAFRIACFAILQRKSFSEHIERKRFENNPTKDKTS